MRTKPGPTAKADVVREETAGSVYSSLKDRRRVEQGG